MTNQTKAQLQAENEVLKAKNAELETKINELQQPKEDSEKEFNYFDYFKFNLLKSYFMNNQKTDELTLDMKSFDSRITKWFVKNGVIKQFSYSSDFNVDETGHRIIKVVVKDLDVKATAISKKGKTFSIFNKDDIAKAFKSAIKDQA